MLLPTLLGYQRASAFVNATKLASQPLFSSDEEYKISNVLSNTFFIDIDHVSIAIHIVIVLSPSPTSHSSLQNYPAVSNWIGFMTPYFLHFTTGVLVLALSWCWLCEFHLWKQGLHSKGSREVCWHFFVVVVVLCCLDTIIIKVWRSLSRFHTLLFFTDKVLPCFVSAVIIAKTGVHKTPNNLALRVTM